MARQKNALTKYYIANPVETGEPEYLQLAKWITSVEDGSEDETEDVAYYDGDGTKTTDVTGRKEAYTFDGTFDGIDPAMKLVYDKKRKINDRDVQFKIERVNGETLIGPATLSDIRADEGGGDASEYPAFSVTVTYKAAPTVTPAPAGSPTQGEGTQQTAGKNTK